MIICQVSPRTRRQPSSTSEDVSTSKPHPNNSRLARYGATNLQFGIYYDKIFKKEYLPSRIRYNQFFFYGITLWFFYTLHTNVIKQ